MNPDGLHPQCYEAWKEDNPDGMCDDCYDEAYLL